MTYLFLDIETTGLDPKRDFILEIAWLLTDDTFKEKGVRRSFLVDQEDWGGVFDRMDSFVYKMHEQSGLMEGLSDANTDQHSLDTVYNFLHRDLVLEAGLGNTTHLAGFSIHFDKGFLLENDFGSLFTQFGAEPPLIHHRMLDLSSIKLMLKSLELEKVVAQPSNLKPHRALHDCVEALHFAQNFKDSMLGSTFPFPPVKVEELA